METFIQRVWFVLIQTAKLQEEVFSLFTQSPSWGTRLFEHSVIKMLDERIALIWHIILLYGKSSKYQKDVFLKIKKIFSVNRQRLTKTRIN